MEKRVLQLRGDYNCRRRGAFSKSCITIVLKVYIKYKQ